MVVPSSSRAVSSLSRSVHCCARSALTAQERLCAPQLARSYSAAAVRSASTSSASSPAFPGIPERKHRSDSSRRHSSVRRHRNNSEEQTLSLVSVNLESGELDLVSAYSILREVERVYGKIREFVIRRNEFDPSRLTGRIIIQFESDESVLKIQKSGQRLHPIRVPSRTPVLRNAAVDGGVGLADISDLLRPIHVDTDGYDRVSMSAMGQSRTSTHDTSEGSPEGNAVNGRIEDESSNMATHPPNETPDASETILYIEMKIGAQLQSWNSAHRTHTNEIHTSRTEKKRLSRAFIEWGGFYRHAPEVHDSSAPADIVSEATEAMEKALRVSKDRLYKLGELDFAPEDPNQERDPFDSRTSLEEPAEASSETLAASGSEPLQDHVDASKALENENTPTTPQGQDSVSHPEASKALIQETASSPQIEESPIEESPPTYPQQPAKANDLRSKLMRWFSG